MGTALSASDGTGVNALCGNDQDAGDSLYMNVTTATGDVYAERVDGFCFVLKTARTYDYENRTSYTNYKHQFTVQLNVLDTHNVSSESIDLTVQVVDRNEPPEFPSVTRSVDLTHANSGDPVGAVVVAFDPDINDTLTYAIVGGNTGNPFDGVLNTNDGTYQLITTRDDITTSGSGIQAGTPVVLTVRATDASGEQVDATITINIVQSNRAPVLSAVNFTLFENAPTHSFVGTVPGIDPDGNALTWSVVSGGARSYNVHFRMDNHGHLHQDMGNAWDYETGPRVLVLRVSATDGTLSVSVAVHVEVLDVNEPPYHNDLELSVSEGARTDAVLHVLYGNDPEHDVLSYTILTGNDQNHFSFTTVGASLGSSATTTDEYAVVSKTMDTGVVLSSVAGLNYERHRVYHLTMRVSDRACPCLTDPLAPCYGVPSSSKANANANADADSDDQYRQCHALLADGSCGGGSDYLCGGLHSVFAITIHVIDANDAPILEPDQLRHVKESDGEDIRLGSPLRALDEDTDATLTWSLLSCDASLAVVGVIAPCPFQLDETSGLLSVHVKSGAVLDFETVPEWKLEVQVEDQWGSMDSGMVTVVVMDVNERPTIVPSVLNRTVQVTTTTTTTYATTCAATFAITCVCYYMCYYM